ncbi:MAG: phosphopantetheine-binding protein, partial [Blastocatellia bacterium]
SAFVIINALPLTSNGKVDRSLLPAPDGEISAANRIFVPPGTQTELELARIWSEVLGLSRIGIHDNFFELGGHSLLATQVVSRVRDALKIELPLRIIFERSTIAAMAETIRGLGRDVPSILPLSRETRRVKRSDLTDAMTLPRNRKGADQIS